MLTNRIPNIQFRKLDQKDAQQIYDIELQCFSLPWSREQCMAAFLQPTFHAYGLLKKDRLVGYISIYHVLEEVEILNFAVIPAERRLGHGKLILSNTLRVAEKLGIKRVTLEVRENNLPALALYESCQFSIFGKRKKYYPDSGEDALLMEHFCKSI